ncbi:MAG: PEPxxWA-CTERM sorting domain-containing protein [Sphingomonadaceae bacterium]
MHNSLKVLRFSVPLTFIATVASADLASAAVMFGDVIVGTSSTSAAFSTRSGAISQTNSTGSDYSPFLIPLVSAFAPSAAQTLDASASATAIATAAFRSSGSVSFTAVANLFASATSAGNNALAFSNGYRFLYRFELTNPAQINVIYRLDELDTDNLATILISGPITAGRTVGGPLGDPLAGAFSEMFVPGFYSIFIDSNGNGTFANSRIQSGPGVQSVTGIRHVYGIEITNAVPEPGTWAMMLAGFALIGLRIRRRAAIIRQFRGRCTN